MLAALDMIAPESDRLSLQTVLQNLLLQKKVPPARGDLSPEGARWYRLATMHEDQSDANLAKRIEDGLAPALFMRLDPMQQLKHIRCPVFLIHGEYDDLIPPQESQELQRNIPGSRLLMLPFLTHTHPVDKPLSGRRQMESVLAALRFGYQFSQATQ
jgi:pimeloyl-ACP methyl ester carboxylesterase